MFQGIISISRRENESGNLIGGHIYKRGYLDRSCLIRCAGDCERRLSFPSFLQREKTIRKSLQSSELKSLNAQEFLQMLCANAPWSIVGKEGENISFQKKKKMVQEKYDQIMNQERRGQS